jgi:DNA helicase-2/ATP-dependent DNA helicase PcrA
VYGWNGADPTLLTGFTDEFPTAAVLRLDDNFRSSAEIVAVAASVSGGGRSGAAGAGLPAAGAGLPAAGAGLPAAASLGEGSVPTVTAWATADAEAEAIARATRDRHGPGRPWSDMAVLTRTNAQLETVATACAAAGVPSRMQGGRRLASLDVVRDLLDGRLPDLPARGLVADARRARADDTSDARGRELAAFLDALGAYLDLEPQGTVGGLSQWLDVAGRALDEPAGDAVVLSSFHRAKGLEWPIVFVAGLEDGFVPLTGAGRAADAEERRLLYVAITRARMELHCSWARSRVVGGRPVARHPSPWLGPLEAAVAELTRLHRPVDGRGHLLALRRQLEAMAPG